MEFILYISQPEVGSAIKGVLDGERFSGTHPCLGGQAQGTI